MMKYASEANPGDYESFCREIQAILSSDDPLRLRIEELTLQQGEGPISYEPESVKAFVRRNAAWRDVLKILPEECRKGDWYVDYMVELFDRTFYPDCLYDADFLCKHIDSHVDEIRKIMPTR